jgi:hypothetical protein
LLGSTPAFQNDHEKKEVERVTVADGEALFFFDPQGGLPEFGVVIDPEIRDFERVGI